MSDPRTPLSMTCKTDSVLFEGSCISPCALQNCCVVHLSAGDRKNNRVNKRWAGAEVE